MTKSPVLARVAVAVAVVCVAVSAACALPTWTVADTASPLQPAPPFQNISRTQVRSAMGRLADGITTLDRLFDAGAPPQEEVLRAIDDMEAAVATLSPGMQTNHPRLDRELPRFAADLKAARAAAAAAPPQYLPAQALSSACLRCHGGRR